MNAKILIIQEIEQVPEPLLEEVLEFLRFLKAKQSSQRLETAVLSESSLRKNWLSQEEDEAWQDL